MTNVSTAEFVAPRSIILKPIIHCCSSQQARVREIRNQDGVRAAMYSDHLITIDEHQRWLARLANDPSQIVFAVLDENAQPVGVVSLNAIDRLHRKSDWAFYLAESERGGLGAALECALINFAFDALHLEKLNCEVIETNETVVRLHKKFHFVEEGFRRANIEKYGKRIGVFLLGLTREDWMSRQAQTREKYASVFSKFTVTIEHGLCEPKTLA